MSAVSSETMGFCECCRKTKLVRLYVLQNGETAWVCKECRK